MNTSPEDRFFVNFSRLSEDLIKFIKKANSIGFNGLSPVVVNLATQYVNGVYKPQQIIEAFITKSFELWDRINYKMIADQVIEAYKPSGDIRKCSRDEINNFLIQRNTPSREVILEMLLNNERLTEMDRLVEDNVGVLFPIVDPKYFQPFSELWKSFMSEEDKIVVWRYTYAFVKISIKYLNANSEFAKKFNPNLPELAARWSITL